MKNRIIIFLLLSLMVFPLQTLAHPGRTDENGGHVDSSTGIYHYHHGYPAHQHENGVCPYNFDDKTGENSGSSGTSDSSSYAAYLSESRQASLTESESSSFEEFISTVAPETTAVPYDDTSSLGIDEKNSENDFFFPIAIGIFFLYIFLSWKLAQCMNGSSRKELLEKLKEKDVEIINLKSEYEQKIQDSYNEGFMKGQQSQAKENTKLLEAEKQELFRKGYFSGRAAQKKYEKYTGHCEAYYEGYKAGVKIGRREKEK